MREAVPTGWCSWFRGVQVRIRTTSLAVSLAVGLLAALAWIVQGVVADTADDNATPRLADGKPDFSGLWAQPYVPNMTAGQAGLQPIANLREGDDLPYTDWGREEWENYNPTRDGDYAGSCYPFGLTRSFNSPWPIQIIQNEDAIAFLFEQNTWFHWVPTDGRGWPDDVPSAWTGYSTAHYDGDTLVVETTNFNGWTKLDTVGHPHSDELRIVQTFERPTLDRIEHTLTIHDPQTYTEPWTNVRTWRLRGDDEFILEYACMENNTGLFDGSITPWTPPQR